MLRMNSAFKKMPKVSVDYKEITDPASDLTKRLRDSCSTCRRHHSRSGSRCRGHSRRN